MIASFSLSSSSSSWKEKEEIAENVILGHSTRCVYINIAFIPHWMVWFIFYQLGLRYTNENFYILISAFSGNHQYNFLFKLKSSTFQFLVLIDIINHFYIQVKTMKFSSKIFARKYTCPTNYSYQIPFFYFTLLYFECGAFKNI